MAQAVKRNLLSEDCYGPKLVGHAGFQQAVEPPSHPPGLAPRSCVRGISPLRGVRKTCAYEEDFIGGLLTQGATCRQHERPPCWDLWYKVCQKRWRQWLTLPRNRSTTSWPRQKPASAR